MADGDVLSFTNNPYFQGASVGLGGIGDIWSFIQNLQRTGNLSNIYQILQNPAKFSAYIGQLMPQYSKAAVDQANRGYLANQSNLTGGATGGFLNQYLANAWANRTAEDWAQAQRTALGGLGEASGTASRMPQQPLGAMGGVMNALKMLAQLRGQGGGGGGIMAYPLPGGGGGGFSGGSEGFRGDYAPMPSFQPDSTPSAFDFGGAGY